MRATRDGLALATIRGCRHHFGFAVQYLHAFGFDQRVQHERAAGFTLAPAAMAAVHEQRRAGEAVADETAVAPALEAFGRYHGRFRTRTGYRRLRSRCPAAVAAPADARHRGAHLMGDPAVGAGDTHRPRHATRSHQDRPASASRWR